MIVNCLRDNVVNREINSLGHFLSLCNIKSHFVLLGHIMVG